MYSAPNLTKIKKIEIRCRYEKWRHNFLGFRDKLFSFSYRCYKNLEQSASFLF